MDKYSIKNNENKKWFKNGIIAGIPIAFGYFAVSFSLGICANNAGLTPFQGLIVSMLCNASAGEYAGFTLIASNAPYIEVAFVTFITNARYILMSCAISQKVDSDLPIHHRVLMSYDMTDEIFSINMAKHSLNPYYTYGAVIVALPCWAIGTSLGIITGNILPMNIVSALSVALYGMFLASIIPPAKKNKVIACIIIISFISSYICQYIPFISTLSDGIKVILLTVSISSIAAILFPKREKEEN